MKIRLFNGCCKLRFRCKKADSIYCREIHRNINKDCIECNYFKKNE